MGRFYFVQSEKSRIELEDGQWIEYRMKLNLAGHRQFHNALIEARMDPETNEARISLKPADHAYLILKHYITDWLLFGPNGQPMSFTPEAIDQLDPDFAQLWSRIIDDTQKAYEEGKVLTPMTSGE